MNNHNKMLNYHSKKEYLSLFLNYKKDKSLNIFLIKKSEFILDPKNKVNQLKSLEMLSIQFNKKIN